MLTKLVWEEAQRQGALTTLGQGLGGKVDLVTAANQKLGYGLLSALGKEEHANLATRLAARLPTLLNSSEPHCIKVVTSGKDRANESAFYFMESLKRNVSYVSDSAQCYLTQDDPSKIDKKLVNKFELYFHKTAPEGITPATCPPMRATSALSATKMPQSLRPPNWQGRWISLKT